MRITYKGDYSLKAVLQLSINNGKLMTINELAKKADIPVKFLEQVLLNLKKAGFVESRRGKIGGYLLAKHPSKIKLGEVLRYIDGPIEPISCVQKGYTDCADVGKCVLRGVWQDVAHAISSIVDNITFEDLVKEVKSRNKDISYSI